LTWWRLIVSSYLPALLSNLNQCALNEQAPVGAIVGGSIAGLALLGAIILAALFKTGRLKTCNRDSSPSPGAADGSSTGTQYPVPGAASSASAGPQYPVPAGGASTGVPNIQWVGRHLHRRALSTPFLQVVRRQAPNTPWLEGHRAPLLLLLTRPWRAHSSRRLLSIPSPYRRVKGIAFFGRGLANPTAYIVRLAAMAHNTFEGTTHARWGFSFGLLKILVCYLCSDRNFASSRPRQADYRDSEHVFSSIGSPCTCMERSFGRMTEIWCHWCPLSMLRST